VKIFVVILVLVIVLAGGAFSVLKYMEIGPFAPEDAISEDTVISNEPSVFIDVEPLLVNIFQDSEVATVIQISIKLETRGKDNASYVNKQLPKITDILLRDMHSFLPRVMKKEGAELDVFVLKKRLKLMIDKLIPDRRVHDVLIQSVSEG
jgi:flagellar basal body-associated protein FliL